MTYEEQTPPPAWLTTGPAKLDELQTTLVRVNGRRKESIPCTVRQPIDMHLVEDRWSDYEVRRHRDAVDRLMLGDIFREGSAQKLPRNREPLFAADRLASVVIGALLAVCTSVAVYFAITG